MMADLASLWRRFVVAYERLEVAERRHQPASTLDRLYDLCVAAYLTYRRQEQAQAAQAPLFAEVADVQSQG